MTTLDHQADTPVEHLSSAVHAERHIEEDQIQIVTFEVGHEEFAIDILAVQEIIRMTQVTRVPQSPASVEGVVNFRGQITPVVDLRKRFDFEAQDRGKDARIVIVEVQGRIVGFIVDRVHEVLRIDNSILDPAPTLASSVNADYVNGVGKLNDRLVILLSLERLFGQGAWGELDQAVQQAA